jgi:hypothetical protein
MNSLGMCGRYASGGGTVNQMILPNSTTNDDNNTET